LRSSPDPAIARLERRLEEALGRIEELEEEIGFHSEVEEER
jgi:hypothetical protein